MRPETPPSAQQPKVQGEINMEHTRKLIITLCMVALLLISGCATQTAQTTVISIPDKTSIQEKTPIKIGALLPLSGPNAKYGEEIRQGIELAREELNSQGGINGRNVEVLYEDDQADPKTGVSAIQKLIDVEGVHVILGPWASGVALATAPIAEDKKVIMLAEAIAPAISDAGGLYLSDTSVGSLLLDGGCAIPLYQ